MKSTTDSKNLESALRISKRALSVNAMLAGVKVFAGIVGHSYALIADGVESTLDIFSSLIVWGGLHISSKPADEEHPYGHGKAEALAGVAVALMLLGTAAVLAAASVREIRMPHHAPAPFTLLILLLVIVVKETLYRMAIKAGKALGSTAVQGDAWHHRSDALTSLAAFVGISIAVWGGKGYEMADDWAALAACGIIAWNGWRLFRAALDEVMDASVPPKVVDEIRKLARTVEGVVDIEKCRIRKIGWHLSMDIHVVVDGDLSVRKGHEIGHQVKQRLIESSFSISDVVVHVEPHDLEHHSPQIP